MYNIELAADCSCDAGSAAATSQAGFEPGRGTQLARVEDPGRGIIKVRTRYYHMFSVESVGATRASARTSDDDSSVVPNRMALAVSVHEVAYR